MQRSICVDGYRRNASICTYGMREHDETGIAECGYNETSN
jgi:hypothetical protein